MMTEQILERATTFSPCRKYRYTLWREWACKPVWGRCNLPSGHAGQHDGNSPIKFVQFIGLNPSTADETKDDPTIRRCIGFAKAWGYSALCMTNLFAWRDTLPANMKKASEPIGLENDQWLLRIAKEAGLVVAAWGKNGNHLYRNFKVKRLLNDNGILLHCLRNNKDGSPEHPLYLPANLKPQLH